MSDPRSAIAGIENWCHPRAPEEWQDLWGRLGNGHGLDPYREYWVIYRGWGPEGVDLRFSAHAVDVREDWTAFRALYDLACTTDERLNALREAGYGFQIVTSTDNTPEEVAEYRQWFSEIDLGDSEAQAEYLYHTVLLEVIDIDAVEVTEADLVEFTEEFPSIKDWRRATQSLWMVDFSENPRPLKRRGVMAVSLAINYEQHNILQRVHRHHNARTFRGTHRSDG
ncbi:hypothetical protein ACX1DX_13055 [Tessaracoccus sp. Y36]